MKTIYHSNINFIYWYTLINSCWCKYGGLIKKVLSIKIIKKQTRLDCLRDAVYPEYYFAHLMKRF